MPLYAHHTESEVISISTDATADNLPGPGRTLGQLYDFVGEIIEKSLARVALRMGCGPSKAMKRILHHYGEVSSQPTDSARVAALRNKMEKDVKRLLKYSRSYVEANQLLALDSIIALAVYHPSIRDLLLKAGAVAVIQRARFSHALLSPSRKALLSLEDTKVNALVHNFEERHPFSCRNDNEKSQLLWDTKSYLNGNPDSVFLFVRQFLLSLGRLGPKLATNSSYTLEFLMALVNVSSNLVEWETLDCLISVYVRWAFGVWRENVGFSWYECPESITPVIESLLRLVDKLPQTRKLDFLRWFAETTYIDYHYEPFHAYLTYCLLCGFEKRVAKRRRGNGSPTFDLIDLQNMYPSYVLQPLLHRLTCPPEELISRILAARLDPLGSRPHFLFWEARVVEPGELRCLCKELSQFVDSEDDMIREGALQAFKILLSIDIYCRTEAVYALSAIPFAQKGEYTELLKVSKEHSTPQTTVPETQRGIIRHRDSNGCLLHIYVDDWTSRSVCCEVRKGTKQNLQFASGDLLELHVPRGTAFSAAGHNPLYAGTTRRGKRAYIARAKNSGFHDAYVAIPDGTNPENLHVRFRDEMTWAEKILTPQHLTVLVLRYEPDAYARCERFADDRSGVDATGPYSWKSWPRDVWSSDEETSEAGIFEEEDKDESSSCASEHMHRRDPDATDGFETADEWESVNLY